MKTRILAMNPAKWLQTANIMATSTTKLTYPIQFVWLARFARLSLKMCLPPSLRSAQKILHGVTGSLVSGTMTAIMGPSGCGKSTFISALTNRIKDGGKVEGDISINGERKPLISIQHLVG
tara:strand:+ start:122 stop:484 length:363 start_codon:yes stop_codon:yes gene_type:complete